MLFAAVHMAAFGTKRTCRHAATMSALGANPDTYARLRAFRPRALFGQPAAGPMIEPAAVAPCVEPNFVAGSTLQEGFRARYKGGRVRTNRPVSHACARDRCRLDQVIGRDRSIHREPPRLRARISASTSIKRRYKFLKR